MSPSAVPPALAPESSGATDPSPAPVGASSAPDLSGNVVALGWTSLFTDVSSEMIIPVLPAFVTGTLHASVASLGVIEGVAECTATVLRIFSGWLSDRIGRRKPFLILGYGISGVAKSSMAVASSWVGVLGLRFSDRLGKSLRSPARDALIVDSVPASRIGNAFGLHSAMDTAGAALGPIAAFLLLRSYPGGFRRVFLVAAIPALLSIAVLAAFVRAPRRPPPAVRRGIAGGFKSLPAPVWKLLAVSVVFSLGGSSLAFVILRAGQSGLTPAHVTLLYALYNVVYALLAWPLGRLSDRLGRRPLLFAAYVVFALCYALLGARATPAAAIGAFVGLGLHSALLEGSQRSLVADLAGPDQRGTAYGAYYTVVGFALLPSSVLAGWLWDRFGAPVTFFTGASLALSAAVLFAILLPAHRERSDRHAHAA
jgi:MFS family permease